MQRVLLAIGFAFVFSAQSFGQAVQWATKVIEFSSELTPIQYSANQILGKPNVLPSGGQNPGAWTPDRPKRKEYIKVGFANPIQIEQVAIGESHNPGSLTAIYAYDVDGKEYLLRTFNPMVVPRVSRMLNFFMPKTTYKVAAIKLEFDGAALSDYFSIDAVAISDINYPVIANISLPELLNSGIVVERLDEKVNSEYAELNPLLSPDGKTLYFSRKNHPGNVGGVNDKEDIWFSELGPDGKWTLAKNMGPEFNNEYPNFINSVSSATPDGKSVLLLGNKYLPNGKVLAGVSISDNINGKWSKPKAVNIEDDYNFNDKANYFLTNSRKALLLAVERDDSRGDRDLYVSFERTEGDTLWTKPLNLGDIINTAGDESAPFLASDDKTLYFSSTGYSGYGGADIFVSKRLDDTWTNWTEPQNMGPDINSKTDDLYFNIPSTSEYAYYSRGVSGENSDIYRAKLPFYRSPEPVVIVKGKLIDSKTGKPIGAKIIYERLPDGKVMGTTTPDPVTGEYEIHLPGGLQYGVRAEAKDHLSESQNLDLRDFVKDATIQNKDINLAPLTSTTIETIQVARVEENATIRLNNLFYDFDDTNLRPASFPELNRLVTLMNDKPTMEVEIAGHADGLGGAAYNMKLSEKRAKVVANYLIGKGIAKERIYVTYFGETRPIAPNKRLADRRKNRRVEFKIVKL